MVFYLRNLLLAGAKLASEPQRLGSFPPQPLDEDVVHLAASTIHRDADADIPQGVKLVNCEP